MIVGVPREIKDNENRIAIVPAGVDALKADGHVVLVEKGAGVGSGISDEELASAGAEIVPSHADVFARADMIIKVKEPLPEEYRLCRPAQILFTYFHFAASRGDVRGLGTVNRRGSYPAARRVRDIPASGPGAGVSGPCWS